MQCNAAPPPKSSEWENFVARVHDNVVSISINCQKFFHVLTAASRKHENEYNEAVLQRVRTTAISQ